MSGAAVTAALAEDLLTRWWRDAFDASNPHAGMRLNWMHGAGACARALGDAEVAQMWRDALELAYMRHDIEEGRA